MVSSFTVSDNALNKFSREVIGKICDLQSDFDKQFCEDQIFNDELAKSKLFALLIDFIIQTEGKG